MRWAVLAALAIGLLLLALYPLVATGYGIRFMLQLFMWVALAQSWNLISGLTGYVSFGREAFFGTGAYAGARGEMALHARNPEGTEFDFRYSHRSGLGVDDTQRTQEVLKSIAGKRLTYRRSDEGAHA